MFVLEYARTHLSQIFEQFLIIYSHLFKLAAADVREKYGKFNIIDFWQLLFNLCENRKKLMTGDNVNEEQMQFCNNGWQKGQTIPCSHNYCQKSYWANAEIG